MAVIRDSHEDQFFNGLVDDTFSLLDELRSGGKHAGSAKSWVGADARIRAGAACMCVEKPEKLDREVFNDLVGPALDYLENGASFVPLDDSALSLPERGAVPKDLAVLLGPTGEDEVASFVSSALLPNEVQARRLAAPDTPVAYLDPGLRKSRRRYLRLIRRLVDCSALSFGVQSFCDVGLFAVTKKSGKQRLVVDARRANLCFDEPPGVSLPTAAAFSQLELRHGDELHASQFDLSNAFYQKAMPEALRPYFSLPAVQCREVGIFRVGNHHLQADDWIYP